jgi:uncharacterized membrane protein
MSTGFVMTVLFVVSEAVGIAIGQWFFHLFVKAVPPAAMSQFNAQNSRLYFWAYGGGVGVILFVWAFIGTMVGRMQQMAKSPKT